MTDDLLDINNKANDYCLFIEYLKGTFMEATITSITTVAE